MNPMQTDELFPTGRICGPVLTLPTHLKSLGNVPSERICETRYPTTVPVQLWAVSPEQACFEGVTQNVSGSRLEIELTQPISRYTVVEVTFDGHPMLIRGEVVGCEQVTGGAFRVAIDGQKVFLDEQSEEHFEADALGLYLYGQGLTAPDVIRLRHHLRHCEACNDRLSHTRQILEGLGSDGQNVSQSRRMCPCMTIA